MFFFQTAGTGKSSKLAPHWQKWLQCEFLSSWPSCNHLAIKLLEQVLFSKKSPDLGVGLGYFTSALRKLYENERKRDR